MIGDHSETVSHNVTLILNEEEYKQMGNILSLAFVSFQKGSPENILANELTNDLFDFKTSGCYRDRLREEVKDAI